MTTCGSSKWCVLRYVHQLERETTRDLHLSDLGIVLGVATKSLQTWFLKDTEDSDGSGCFRYIDKGPSSDLLPKTEELPRYLVCKVKRYLVSSFEHRDHNDRILGKSLISKSMPTCVDYTKGNTSVGTRRESSLVSSVR